MANVLERSEELQTLVDEKKDVLEALKTLISQKLPNNGN